ncbi:hypothetical protein J5Y03_11510 [Bacillus sp. RG28]|uniref:Uncharacterized protein n=1 Tax=Gottfriedia endophytica TaxID=2820819 RepID=A0A940NQP5_9BACI|nr:hypothetical protein [Gottfriedia endophytica]MBP0725798.1 hypothetical protein [Gottfriedia endophytica]
MDERKKSLKTSLILGLVIIIIVLAIAVNSFTKIQSSYNKFIVHKTKKDSIVTKYLTTDEIRQLFSIQDRLRYKYSVETKTNWLYWEISDGANTVLITDNYMSRHPEYDSAKIKFKVNKYTVDGKTVEFMSNSKIIQVHSKDGWKDK